MSAEIPGSKVSRAETSNVTDLVEKILICTMHTSAEASVYAYRVGSYATEITLTALQNAGLLAPDFTMERFNQAVAEIDTEMGLDSMATELRQRDGVR